MWLISVGVGCKEISDTSLDARNPSFPLLRSATDLVIEKSSGNLFSDSEEELERVVEFLQNETDFLLAAETGNIKALHIILRRGTDIQQKDHLGRNALHLALGSYDLEPVELLLLAGVDPNVQDDIGTTPLSLCLMRRPSYEITKLLFDHGGAEIQERTSPMDTGLFLQFVMMCTPTAEEAQILELLIDNGAMVDDPEAPGGRQALHIAAMNNNCDLIRVLIDLDADLFLTNHRDETPKEVAVAFGCKEAVALLNMLEIKAKENFIKDLNSSMSSSPSSSSSRNLTKSGSFMLSDDVIQLSKSPF